MYWQLVCPWHSKQERSGLVMVCDSIKHFPFRPFWRSACQMKYESASGISSTWTLKGLRANHLQPAVTPTFRIVASSLSLKPVKIFVSAKPLNVLSILSCSTQNSPVEKPLLRRVKATIRRVSRSKLGNWLGTELFGEQRNTQRNLDPTYVLAFP